MNQHVVVAYLRGNSQAAFGLRKLAETTQGAAH
jgi:hypothetical protein